MGSDYERVLVTLGRACNCLDLAADASAEEARHQLRRAHQACSGLEFSLPHLTLSRQHRAEAERELARIRSRLHAVSEGRGT